MEFDRIGGVYVCGVNWTFSNAYEIEDQVDDKVLMMRYYVWKPAGKLVIL